MGSNFLKESPALRILLIWVLWGVLSLTMINLLSRELYQQLIDWFMSLPYRSPMEYLPQMFYGLLFFVVVTAFIRTLTYIKMFLYSTAAFLVIVFYTFASISPDSDFFLLVEIFFGLNSPVWARAIYIIMWSFFVAAIFELLLIRFISTGRYRQEQMVRQDFDRLLHQHDLNYRAIQIFIWAIPTLGFLGTVVGISFALQQAADIPSNMLDQTALEVWFTNIVHSLGYAFYTTIAGLVFSTLITILGSFVSAIEEQEINDRIAVGE